MGGCEHPVTPVDGAILDADLWIDSVDADLGRDSDLDAHDTWVGDPLECGYPTAGYGYIEGRVLEPFLLRDCDGQEVHLSRRWCGQEATIIHLSVAWCGTCEADTARLNSEVMEALEGEAVQLVEVLVERAPGVVATEGDCSYWQSSFDPPVTTYIPPSQSLGPALDLLTDADALPLTVVVDDLGIIRVWSGATIPSNLVDRVVEILE